MASRTRRILASTIAPVLIAGGVAFAAQSYSGSDGNGRPPGHGRGGPPLLAPNLTYAELHVLKDGQAKVIRIDRGKLKSSAADSITITENDGNDVTIPIDDGTKVFVGPGKPDAEIGDIEVGKLVTAKREQGQPADLVAVVPDFARLKRFGQRLRNYRPSGAPFGSAPAPTG